MRINHLIFAIATISLVCTDARAGWEDDSSGSEAGLRGVHSVDGNKVWAVGGKGPNQVILHKEHRDSSWKAQVDTIGKHLYSVYFSSDSAGWAVGNDGTIVHTSNGTSWSSQSFPGTTTPPHPRLFGVHFVDATTGWAVGQKGTLIRTTDGGTNWNAVEVGTDSILASVFFIDRDTGWIVGEKGLIYKSDDGGDTWSAQTNKPDSADNEFRSVFFVNDSVGWTAGREGWILKTTNGGESWAGDTINSSINLYSIRFSNTNKGWVCGDSGYVYYSSNGGETWNQQTSGTDVRLNAIHMVNSNVGWIVGFDGTILFNDDADGGSAVNLSEKPRRGPAMQNYPNPFNPRTTISFELMDDGFVNLTIYDLLGREVVRLVDGRMTAGHHSFEFDPRNLASGIYFYKLTIGTFSNIKKMMLLR